LHHYNFIRSKDSHAPKENRRQIVERSWKQYDMSNPINLHIYAVQKEKKNHIKNMTPMIAYPDLSSSKHVNIPPRKQITR
jgi:hypothetical protein